MAEQLTVEGVKIRVDKNNYINITDIAKYRSNNPSQVIANWMRLIYTIRFLAVWEQKHNEAGFNLFEYEQIRNQAGATRQSGGQTIDREERGRGLKLDLRESSELAIL